MYLVSDEYKTKIQELDRVFSIEIRIEHKDGTLILGDKELAQGSFNFFDGSQASDEFTVGGTVASHLEFTLVNKELYDDISFIGARVVPTIKFMLREGVQAHFLQPSQPSKMLGFDDEQWEFVPLGQFNIDIADRKRTTIDIKAIDNMINLDIPYSLSTLSYPASLWQIYVDICNVTDVTVGNTSFPNQGYIVQEKPVGDLTFRNVLGFVAELSGTFSKFNRIGELELRWYRETGVILTSKHRSSLEMSDFQIQITGVSVETDDKDVNDNPISYITGTDDYAIDLTGNELLQGNYASVLPNILGNIEDTIFTPYTANFHGNPALESGDIITHIDVDGNVFKTLITHSKYKYRGTSVLDAKGLPNISRGFNSTDGRIAQIIKKVDKEIGNKLTTLEQEQLNATELIGNMLGGYVTEIKYEDDPNFARFGIGVFIHDQKLLANSNKLWKWGIGGFGYSENGGLTYTTGVTASGSIVAELVTANIITADMVNTGLLSSTDNSSWFNLDTGEINIKDQLKFINGQLTLSGIDSGNKVFNTTPTTPYKINDLWKVSGVAGVDFKICTTARASGNYVASDWTNITDSKNYADLIKNLTTGTAIKGGTTTIDNTKVRVNHGSTSEYSELNALGFARKGIYGDSYYLNDITVLSGSTPMGYNNENDEATWTSVVRIPLDVRFRGKTIEPYVSLRSYNLPVPLDDNIRFGIADIETLLRVVTWNTNISNPSPYVEVRGYSRWKGYLLDSPAYYYRNVDFQLMVVAR